MKTINYIIFLLSVAILLLGSCISEDMTDERSKPAVISVSFDNLQVRSGELFSGESAINKVRICVFAGNNLNEMQIFNSGEGQFKNPFTIKTTTGSKTVYVIANEPDDLTASLDAVTNLNALKGISASASASLTAPLTMVGFAATNVEYASDPSSNSQVTIQLIRTVSNLNLKVKKHESTNAEILLREVRLCRIPSKTALIEGEPVSGQTYWDCIHTGDITTPLTTTGTDVWAEETGIYMFENLGNKSDTTDRATYLIIDATYNGVDTRYSAYINDESSDATDHKYSTKRNHQYNIVATINNIGEVNGLTLSTYVSPWNILGTNWLFERTFAISPHPIIGEHSYTTLSPDHPISFTFILHNPVGATWSAQLSNPVDFNFSLDNGAVRQGEVGTEYTISIIPFSSQGIESRTTEFYITVDGVEIPLIRGSTLVGGGNRIVINQPAVTP